MKSMKTQYVQRRITAALTVLLLLFCTATPAFGAQHHSYKNGVYAGSGWGYGDGLLELEVTVSGGQITGIVIGDNDETPDRLALATAGVIPQIIEKQSVDVDTVSGATYSSEAIIEAVAEALDSAYENDIFESGYGTEDAPYIIADAAQLAAFANSVGGG